MEKKIKRDVICALIIIYICEIFWIKFDIEILINRSIEGAFGFLCIIPIKFFLTLGFLVIYATMWKKIDILKMDISKFEYNVYLVLYIILGFLKFMECALCVNTIMQIG